MLLTPFSELGPNSESPHCDGLKTERRFAQQETAEMTRVINYAWRPNSEVRHTYMYLYMYKEHGGSTVRTHLQQGEVERGELVEHLEAAGEDGEGLDGQLRRVGVGARGRATVQQHTVHERHDAAQVCGLEGGKQLSGVVQLGRAEHAGRPARSESVLKVR